MGTNVEIIDLTSPKPQIIEILDFEPDQQAGTNTVRPESVQTNVKREPSSNGDKVADSEGREASPDLRKQRTRKRKRASEVPAASGGGDQGSAGRTPEGSETPQEGARQEGSVKDQDRDLRSDKEQKKGGQRKRRRDASQETDDERAQDGGRHRPTSHQAGGGRQCPCDDEREKEDQYVPPPEDQLFFIDLLPVAPSSGVLGATDKHPDNVNDKPVPADKKDTESEKVKLLVPAHVTVLGSTPVDIIPEDGEVMDEDFINYLDYDDSKHMTRYYDEPKDETEMLARTVCKNCGAEGDHKTSQCTIMICLTCGMRNEHSTRSCPISKVCFTCGMKGHINANCPNKRVARAYQASRESECDRCSSSNHKTNECPTVWRLYEYYSAEERAHIIGLRQSKRTMKLGEGGEGFIADDEWCYYCGQSGHWGDDCLDMDQPPDEHSAFGQYNVSLGPFFDPNNKRRASTSRSAVRDWTTVDDRWGKDAPGDVGKKGRMKSRAKLEKQAAKQAEEDTYDWFGRGAGASRTVNRNGKEASKALTFGKGFGTGKQFAPPPPQPKASELPSLLARLDRVTDRHRDRDRDKGYREDGDRLSRRSHKSDSSRRSDSSRKSEVRDSGRYREHRWREERGNGYHHSDNASRKSGPQYKGGYAR